MTCEFCGCEVCINMKCGTCGFDFGILSSIQMDLLSSFLVGHWKEIAKSEHRVAFERILETLNPGALKAVKHLQKVM